MPLHNINLNHAVKKTDQRISDFQTGIGTTADATLGKENLISIPELPLWILMPLPSSERGVTPLSEVHELPRLITFWTGLCLNGVVIQLIF